MRLILLILLAVSVAASASEPFKSASSVRETMEQIRKLPTDDIWWTVNGKDMAWNFKNLHMIFPTVNVYRDGPVRELARRPMKEIGEFVVDTPNGPMAFDDFIRSDQSTTMGVVVLHKGDIVYERYPRMQEYEKPVYWSTSKVFPATVIRILEERGLVDVSLLPEFRNRGIGGALLRDLLERAASEKRRVSLHVLPDNPAIHLYQRLGFTHAGEQGFHQRMEWQPAAGAASSDGAVLRRSVS